MAEYVVGPVMDKVIDACSEYLKDQVGGKTDVEEVLQRLRVTRPQIQAIVSAYSQVEIEDLNLNKWYWQLRDAIDEADDVLDEFEYWKLQKQVIGENKGKRKAEVPVWNIYETVQRALRIGKPAPKSDPNLKKLEVAVHKLYEISAQVSAFCSLVKGVEEKQQKQQLKLHEKRETGALITNVLLGRRKEMEFVSRWLIRNSYERQTTKTTDLYRNISLLSVVGHGGMGKTTLLQHVYKDATTLFDVQMWACVSTNFDVKTLIKNTLESLKNKKPDEETLVSLQKSLQSEVTSKRFLLVLDDIWEEDDAKWENVLAPLQYGSSGSKIVITTRLDSVATKFANLIKKRKKTLALKGLKEKKCLALFNSHAFAGVENPDEEFKCIAGKMVKKLYGCPLAAKVIGGILNSYIDKSYWIKVLNTTIEKVGQGQNHLLPILKLSYIYLPKFLQNCFSFCCIFPQDHEFEKDDLVRMWIALGFIDSSNIQEETPEDTGRRYFNILVQKSFFDEFRHDSGIIYYKMHDILHELAQFVSAQQCFRIEDDRAFSIPKTTRHLSINGIGSSLEVASKKMGELKNLRSLFLSFPVSVERDRNAVSEILMASKSIRLLVIKPSFGYDLDIKTGCLIHLRYLKVECLSLKLLRSISDLYHLQFIILRTLKDLEIDNIGWKELIPNENCRFILDYLIIKDPSATKFIMEPLGRISSVRCLSIKENDELVSIPTETEQWFLKHSSSLFELKFEKLQSLESLPSSLETLSSLNTLRVNNVPQLKLLPNPPASLKILNLYNLKSLKCLPSSLSAISSLETLGLINIPLLKSLPDLPSSLKYLYLEALHCLPPSLSTFSSLKTFTLKNFPLLKSLPNLSSSLRTLYLQDLESLQCLPSSLSAISSLKTLILTNIPLLKSLPDLPSSLKYLNLEALHCLPPSLSTFSSLENLTLKNFPLLKSLPDLPSSLRTLSLQDLESLQCLPSSLSVISSLDALTLINIPLLKSSLLTFPSSLKFLQLEAFQWLHSSFSTFSSLEILKLKNFPLLKSLSDLPSSLTSLVLKNIPLLESLPDLSSPHLKCLSLKNIPLLESLPDLSSSYLDDLKLKKIPLLKSLPDLPSSLMYIHLKELENLDCMPSCLPASLQFLYIIKVPRLLELPDLPASLFRPDIIDCNPQLEERYSNIV